MFSQLLFHSCLRLFFCLVGPEIDPFWYVGRGVRPIGRFGKRVTDSGNVAGLRPVLSSLELLLTALRNNEDFQSTLAQEDSDWLP